MRRLWLAAALLRLLGLAFGSEASTPFDVLEAYKVQNAELLRKIDELQSRLDTCEQAIPSQHLRGSEESLPMDLGEKTITPGDGFEFWGVLLLTLALVCLAAMAAGLTIGLVSLEVMDLELILKTSEADMSDREKLKLRADQEAAETVLPILHDHHRLLVTLLLMNSLANEMLPVVLDELVPPAVAVALSMSLVLIFGEILPSAVFTGPNQLTFASKFVTPVKIFMSLSFVIAVPLAKTLDYILGSEHKGRYNFAQMRAIVSMHRNVQKPGEQETKAVFKAIEHEGLGIITSQEPHNFTDNDQVLFEGQSEKLQAGKRYFVKPCPPPKGRDMLNCFKLYDGQARSDAEQVRLRPGDIESGCFIQQELDEYKIMHGVMELTHMVAKQGTKMLSECFMLEKNEPLTLDTMKGILQSGYSRIPVYDEYHHNVRHFVLVKKMITVSPSDWSPQAIKDLPVEKLICVRPTIHMLDLLNEFQEKKCHLALVADDPDRVEAAWRDGKRIPVDVHMIGIITLEDVIEKMLQEEIFDEVDVLKPPVRYSSRKSLGKMKSSPDPRFSTASENELEQPLLKYAGTAPVGKLNEYGDDSPRAKNLPHQHWS